MADSADRRRLPKTGVYKIQPDSGSKTTGPSDLAKRLLEESGNLLLLHGDLIGRYRVDRVLGTGGFGIVVLALDTVLQRNVAIKLSRSAGLSAKIKANLIEEARAAASLDHPNIVRVFDVDEWGGRSYVVMELVAGKSLAEEIQTRQTISFHRFLVIMKQIVLAMEQLHSRGIIHRDLKPANILIAEHDHVKITDLGLALNDGSPQWKEKNIAGTRQYMAPEQVLGEVHRIDGRTDIWAFGVIAYEMLTLRSPFRTHDDDSIFSQILKGEIASPRQRRPDIPDSLEQLCMRCLSMRMTDRFQSARQLMLALDAVANEMREWDAKNFGSHLSEEPALEIPNPNPATERTSGRSSNHFKDRKSSERHNSDIQDLRGLVPRGLRSFSVEDCEYYQKLMPGPYDLDKRPSILSFWIKWVEEISEPQSVGVLYGPSGCGKSSFLKAALLPSLSESVRTIYFDFTNRNPVEGLVRVLHSHYPETMDKSDLSSILSTIRNQDHRQKLLLVLDQFEQYLIDANVDLGHGMVQALRQCDGSHIQAVILVRDEYWTEISQFMRMMETSLSDSVNAMSFPLMNMVHAKKVFEAFGRAFEMLPDFGEELSESQQAFCRKAIDSLAQDGTVLPVRIALFADLMKHYPWEEKTIAELGGIDGALVRFLSNAFDSKTSPMSRRSVGPACMEILRALLPHDDLDLKSASCSSQALSKAMNTSVGSIDFEQAISCLEKDLHLVTLISSDANEKHYCLVHDYLVYPIRSWLAIHDNLNWRSRLRQDLSNQAIRYERDPRKTNLLSPWNWLLGKLFINRNQLSSEMRKILSASQKRALLWGATYAAGIALFVGMSTGLRYEHLKLAEQRQAQVNDGVYTFLNARQDLGEPWKKISLDQSSARKAVESLVSIEAPSQRMRQTLLKALLNADVSMADLDDSVTASNPEELNYWKKHFSQREALDRAFYYLDGKKTEPPPIKWQYIFAQGRDYRLFELVQRQNDPASEMVKFIAFVAELGQDEISNDSIATRLAKEMVHNYETSVKRDPFLMILAIHLFGLSEEKEVIPKSVADFALANAASPSSSIALPSQWILSKRNGSRMLEFPSSKRSDWTVDEPVRGGKIAMIRVNAGEAVRNETDSKGEVSTKPRLIVAEDIWLAREEVDEQLLSHFFTEQPECRPNAWPDNPDANRAARRLEAVTVLRFCNWLSSKASLQSVYAWEPTDGYNPTNLASVFVNLDANGYRLPSFDEFRFAAISGDFASFRTSMESKSLRQLVSPSLHLERVATWSIFPNAWGFQGISGNLFEMVLNGKLEFCLSTFDAQSIRSLDLAVPGKDSASFQLSNGGFRLARTIAEEIKD